MAILVSMHILREIMNLRGSLFYFLSLYIMSCRTSGRASGSKAIMYERKRTRQNETRADDHGRAR